MRAAILSSTEGIRYDIEESNFKDAVQQTVADSRFNASLEDDKEARSRGIGLATAKKALVIKAALLDGADPARLAQSLVHDEGIAKVQPPAQHAQVRTPEFKKWFGDWEAVEAATPRRDAKKLDSAKSQASAFVGKPLGCMKLSQYLPVKWMMVAPWGLSNSGARDAESDPP